MMLRATAASGYTSRMHSYEPWVIPLSGLGKMIMLYPDADVSVPAEAVVVCGRTRGSAQAPAGWIVSEPALLERSALPVTFQSAVVAVVGPALRMTQRDPLISQLVKQGIVGDKFLIVEIVTSEDPRSLHPCAAARIIRMARTVPGVQTTTISLDSSSLLLLHSTLYPDQPVPVSHPLIPDPA